jgi:hypothetical protein
MSIKKKVPRPVSSKTQRHHGSRHPATRPIDWTPLSLLRISEDPAGLIRFSAPPPSPKQTGGAVNLVAATILH